MHSVLEEMNRYAGTQSDPPPIRGGVFRRWVTDLIAYTDSLEQTIHAQDAEIALLKSKAKGKAA
jgi:hypothetical protein